MRNNPARTHHLEFLAELCYNTSVDGGLFKGSSHVLPVLLGGLRGDGDHVLGTKGSAHFLDEEGEVVFVCRACTASIMDVTELSA